MFRSLDDTYWPSLLGHILLNDWTIRVDDNLGDFWTFQQRANDMLIKWSVTKAAVVLSRNAFALMPHRNQCNNIHP